MNAQRLVTLAKSIRGETRNLPASMKELTTLVRQAIDGPNESNQRLVEDSITQLSSKLSGAESNRLSPGLRQDLEEFTIDGIPATDLIGTGLLQQLLGIFENGYTSVQALDRTQKLEQLVARLDKALTQTVEGLSGLELQSEELQPGESLVGMTVPRIEVQSGMGALIKELQFFDRFMLDLTEVLDGQVHDPQVSSLRSSDFGIDLETALNVAGVFAKIIVGLKTALDLISAYKKLKADAEQLGVTGTIQEIDQKSAERMNSAVQEIQAEVFSHCKVNDVGRVNELKNSITLKINGLANRLDKGFSFEVRTSLPPEPDPEAAAMNEAVTALTRITFTPIDGPRLLALPEGDDAEPKEEPSEKKPRKPKKA